MTETSNIPGELTAEERRVLLAEMLQKKSDQSTLSFAQERLWVLGQLEPESPAYAVQIALRLSGPLDVDVLRRALDEIVRRHDVLRATFVEREGTPVQTIAPAGSLDLTVVDLEELPQEERDERVRERAQDEAGRPFALGQGPLVRAALLLLPPDEHVLLLTMHHIVSDRRSTDVVAGELAALYAAFAAGRPSPL